MRKYTQVAVSERSSTQSMLSTLTVGAMDATSDAVPSNTPCSSRACRGGVARAGSLLCPAIALVSIGARLPGAVA
jgi:hypothetical protein